MESKKVRFPSIYEPEPEVDLYDASTNDCREGTNTNSPRELEHGLGSDLYASSAEIPFDR